MKATEDRPAYTRRHWAKFDDKGSKGIHLLEHHLADVGACFEALLRQPIIRKRFANSGELDDLDETLIARLCVFAALHDIGKANVGFQTKKWPAAELQGNHRPLMSGHASVLVPVLMDKDYKTAEWFFNALGTDEFLAWDDCGGETAVAMMIATLSHHGRPIRLEGGLSENPAIWSPFGELKPQDCVDRIGQLIRQWFPAAFVSGGSLLPAAPAFQHMFLGLCTWADWIGSKDDWFHYEDSPRDDYMETARIRASRAVDAIGLNLREQRNRFDVVPVFDDLFGIVGGPRAIQQAAHDAPLDKPLVIIESETGSGKTEAALWRFARMYEAGLVDGLYFALPTRSAAIQIHGRVERFIAKLFPHHKPPVVCAVPGYEPGRGATGIATQKYNDGAAGFHNNDRLWASEHSKRYLAAQIAVGTVDQALMGALQVNHAHLRAACLARNLLIVDEVHASDTYMSVVLEALLKAHLGAGGYALLMSATLGSSARLRWLNCVGAGAKAVTLTLADAEKAAYPAVSVAGKSDSQLTAAGENPQEKEVSVEASPTMNDFTDTAWRALEAARKGAKVLVVRNTVGNAVSTQQALEHLAGSGDDLLFTVGGIKALHHGRFAGCDRKMLDNRIEEMLGKGRPRGGLVVVGTQTLEQSLDIDADLLITDLCPMDVLLQRIGRLHRQKENDRPDGYDSPTCTVLTPPRNELSPLLKKGQHANGLGPKGYVYRSLGVLEATRRLIDNHPKWRIPEMNRMLVERATHQDELDAIYKEMGDDWKVHGTEQVGAEIADAQHAHNHIIKRDKSFYIDNSDVGFVDVEVNVRTRLGDDRIDIVLDPPQPSPFDPAKRIGQMAVSVRLLPEGDVPESVTPSETEEGFTFDVDDRRFVYDRHGLRRA